MQTRSTRIYHSLRRRLAGRENRVHLLPNVRRDVLVLLLSTEDRVVHRSEGVDPVLTVPQVERLLGHAGPLQRLAVVELVDEDLSVLLGRRLPVVDEVVLQVFARWL